MPPITLAPASLVTGMDSPVTMDSSSAERPSVISPSTGTFSPGRTRNRSPTAICSRAHIFILPLGIHAPRRLWCKAQQRLDRPRCPVARPQFQNLSQQHQHGDHRRRLEINRNRAIHLAEGFRKYLRHKSVAITL